MSTIFSKIISGEIPAYKVYEDEFVCAFLDINPIQKGHTLIVPKVEVDQFFEMEEEIFDKLMHRARYMSQVLKAKTKCERVCVFIEGYGVPHAHIHLVPTNKPEDFNKSLVYSATEEELKEMQALLQS